MRKKKINRGLLLDQIGTIMDLMVWLVPVVDYKRVYTLFKNIIKLSFEKN